MVNDPVGDLVARIRNAGALGRAAVSMPHSSFQAAVADALVSAGYLKSAAKRSKKGRKTLDVELVYREDGSHAISGAKRLSKPSRRLYIASADIFPVKFGRGSLILSTPQGVLTGEEARRRRVGGEQLFIIW